MHVITGELAQVIDIRWLNELRFLHVPAHRIQISGVLQGILAFVTSSCWEFVLHFVRLLFGRTLGHAFHRLDGYRWRWSGCGGLRIHGGHVFLAGGCIFRRFGRTTTALLHAQFFRMHTQLVRATVGTIGEGSIAKFALVWSSASVQITVVLNEK